MWEVFYEETNMNRVRITVDLFRFNYIGTFSSVRMHCVKKMDYYCFHVCVFCMFLCETEWVLEQVFQALQTLLTANWITFYHCHGCILLYKFNNI